MVVGMSWLVLFGWWSVAHVVQRLPNGGGVAAAGSPGAVVDRDRNTGDVDPDPVQHRLGQQEVVQSCPVDGSVPDQLGRNGRLLRRGVDRDMDEDIGPAWSG